METTATLVFTESSRRLFGFSVFARLERISRGTVEVRGDDDTSPRAVPSTQPRGVLGGG